VSIAYRVPMAHSLVVIEKRPWVFFIELFRYLFFGTGMLLAPVMQLAIFVSTLLLGSEGLPQKGQAIDKDILPDIEIMPASVFIFPSIVQDLLKSSSSWRTTVARARNSTNQLGYTVSSMCCFGPKARAPSVWLQRTPTRLCGSTLDTSPTPLTWFPYVPRCDSRYASQMACGSAGTR
jgi:hypothetical protein